MNRFAPAWLPAWLRPDDCWQTRLDGNGWLLTYGDSVTEDYQRRAIEGDRDLYAGDLSQFHIDKLPDKALREILDVCRKEQIAVHFLVMPEASVFRSWYPDHVQSEIATYLERLGREYAVGVIDASAWMPDEAFIGGHHLLPPAAREFTARLRREVEPFLAGHLVPLSKQ